MAQKPITLSKALQDYMAATGKTLPDIDRDVFLKARLMGGLGYLERVAQGFSDDNVYGPQMTDGARTLAAYLIAERKRLGLDAPSANAPAVLAPTPASVPTTVVSSPTRINRGSRKSSRRKTPEND